MHCSLGREAEELDELFVGQAEGSVLAPNGVDLFHEVVEMGSAELVALAELLVLKHEAGLLEVVLDGQ